MGYYYNDTIIKAHSSDGQSTALIKPGSWVRLPVRLPNLYFMSESEKAPQELIHKLSKTVLHAAERGRRALFERMTKQNAEKIAQLMSEPPVFYQEAEDAPRHLLLEDEIAENLPPEFFANPTAWIEAQPNIERRHGPYVMPKGEALSELWDQPYDVTKVKEFALPIAQTGVKEIVSKRIEPKQLQEIARARQAFEVGIPTPRVLAEIVDRGNNYAWFEKVAGLDLDVAVDLIYPKHGTEMHDFVDTVRVCRSEQELRSIIDEQMPKLSGEDYASLIKLWREVWPYIEQQRIVYEVFSVVNETSNKIEQEADINEFKKLFLSGLKKYPLEKYGAVIRKSFNRFAGLDDFIMYAYFFRNRGPIEPVKISKGESDNLANQARIYGEKFRSWYLEKTFGFDYRGEINKLRQLCVDKGIEHKDFAWRNLLVPWDFEKNHPAVEPGKPRLYIIDWELEKKFSQKDANEEAI